MLIRKQDNDIYNQNNILVKVFLLCKESESYEIQEYAKTDWRMKERINSAYVHIF